MKTKVKAVMITIALLISMLGTNVFAQEASEQETVFHLNVIHTNDIHSRVENSESSQILGLGRVKTFADQKRQESDEVLLLDAGDFFHGQSIATMSKGESVAKLMGAVGYDAMTTGNHDWNYGKDQLKNLEKVVQETNSKFAILAGNVETTSGADFFDQEYMVREVEKDGQVLKIGMFGVIDPKIYNSTAPGNVEGLTFTDMEAYANRAAEELRAQGCQIVIGLAHALEPVQLAQKVNGVNLWVTGHEHYAINNTVTTPNGEEALVVEAGYYLWTIGDVELTCSLNEKGELSSLQMQEKTVSYEEGKTITSDAGIENLISQITEEQKPVLEQVVGYTPENLDGVWEHVRIGETTMGKAITSAYILETGADVAFENAGGIRAGMEAGEVTYGDVLNVSPFGNYVVTKNLTGQEILSIAEKNLEIMRENNVANDAGDYDGWPQHSGSALQMGGIRIVYDKDREEGKRIVEAKIQGEEVDLQKEYLVAMNSYVATDTKIYSELEGKPNVHEYSACDEILVKYFGQDPEIIRKDIHTEGLVVYDKTETPGTPEEPKVPETPKQPEQPQNEGTPSKSEAPKTADGQKVWIYAALLGISYVMAVQTRRSKKCK